MTFKVENMGYKKVVYPKENLRLEKTVPLSR